MHGFVHDQNLTHYVDLLEFETDAIKRETLHTLLIEEENRFGSWRARVDQTELLIARARAGVRSQEDIIAKLEADGGDATTARQLLRNMGDTLDLFVQFRRAMNGYREH